MQLIPHAKKDAKLDTKSERQLINEVADMKVGAWVHFFPASLCVRVRACVCEVG